MGTMSLVLHLVDDTVNAQGVSSMTEKSNQNLFHAISLITLIALINRYNTS